MQSKEELDALLARNQERLKEIKNHVYPLSHGDIGDWLGFSRVHICNILNGKNWLYPHMYEALMDIDLKVYFAADGDTARRTEKRLRKVVDDAPNALKVLAEYF